MNVQEIIAMLVQLVLVPLVIYGALLLRNYILGRVKSLQVERALLLASDAVTAAVGQAGQTFVDEIKATQGTLTTEQAAEAFNKALEITLDILGKGGVSLLQTVTGDVNAYLTAKIEEEVRRTRTPSDASAEI